MLEDILSKQQLLLEIERLRQEVDILKQEKADLEILLETNALHADLIEAELLKAKEAAEIASRYKSEFIANISHELRTPLNGILGYTQILLEEEDIPEEHHKDIGRIYQCGEHLLTLINDILDLAKIEAGKIELELKEFQLPKFLKNIVEFFEMRAQQKNIAFHYELLSPLPMGVRGDAKRLRQVLINLLGNAVKFTDYGSVSLKVGYLPNELRLLENFRCQNGDIPPLTTIQIEVQDTGIGIAPEHLQDIFLPFHQVTDSDHKAEGTGLGLAITKQLVEKMGGEIQVKSHVGQGSIFLIHLELPEIPGWSEVKPKVSATP